MTESRPRSDAVESALAWLRGQDPATDELRLERALLDAGYAPVDVATAIGAWRAEGRPAVADLRGRASVTLLLGFVAGWLALTVYLSSLSSLGGIGAAILGFALLIVLGISLLAVGASDSLRAGSRNALTVAIAVPFLFFLVLGGTCVNMVAPTIP